MAVMLPVRLIAAARKEKARRASPGASIPAILTEWADAGRKTKPGKTYRELSAAVTEMKAIHRGERAPSRAFEVVSNGKGGFIRRVLDPEKLREERARLRESKSVKQQP